MGKADLGRRPPVLYYEVEEWAQALEKEYECSVMFHVLRPGEMGSAVHYRPYVLVEFPNKGVLASWSIRQGETVGMRSQQDVMSVWLRAIGGVMRQVDNNPQARFWLRSLPLRQD